MNLRMADGPVANLPAGLDAYAGYTDRSGIGVTFPAVVAAFPAALHLPISVHGQAPAYCGDVEKGALTSWAGYTVGYCAISNAQTLIGRDGRPPKLWTAHYDGELGPHICSAAIPACAAFGFTGQADGTQWTDHAGMWDESVLAADFFDFLNPPPSPAPKEDPVFVFEKPAGAYYVSNLINYRWLPSVWDLDLVLGTHPTNLGVVQAFAGFGVPADPTTAKQSGQPWPPTAPAA